MLKAVKNPEAKKLTDLEYKYGKISVLAEPEVLRAYLVREIANKQNILQKLSEETTEKSKGRAVEIKALLAEGGADLSHIKWGTLYLRDKADASIALEELARAGIPGTLPLVVLQAPVCRPAWLVEMECIAVKEETNPFPVLG